MTLRMHPSIAVHPGEWIRTELLEPHHVGVSRLAAHLRLSRQTISAVLDGRFALSADMAIGFEKAFCVLADTLIQMRSAYDIARARGHKAGG